MLITLMGSLGFFHLLSRESKPKGSHLRVSVTFSLELVGPQTQACLTCESFTAGEYQMILCIYCIIAILYISSNFFSSAF